MESGVNVDWKSKDLGYGAIVCSGDVDKDGMLEIVTGSHNPRDREVNISVFKWNRKSYRKVYQIEINDIPNIDFIEAADINGDGMDEIIFSYSNRLYIYKKIKAEFERIYSIELEGKPRAITVGDIDGDRTNEIIISIMNHIFIYKKNSKDFKVDKISFDSNVLNLELGYFSNKQKKEIAIVLDTRIFIYNYSKKVMIWNGLRISKTKGNVLIAGDVDRDGYDEILYDIELGGVTLIKYYKNKISKLWQNNKARNINNALISDIDADGINEIIITTNSKVYIYSDKKEGFVLKWEEELSNGIISICSGDLKRDIQKEIIIGTKYGYIYVIKAKKLDRQRIWADSVQVLVSETVNVPNEKPDIQKIADAKADIKLLKSKVIKNKIIVDGEIDAKILYVADLPGQPVHYFNDNLIFLQFIHLSGAKPGMHAYVTFDIEHVKARIISSRKANFTVIFEMKALLSKPW